MNYEPKNCARCGIEFNPNSPSQIYCGKECYTIVSKQKDCIRAKKTRAEDKENRKKKISKTDDWKEISRKCYEAGLSYGKMVSMGLL